MLKYSSKKKSYICLKTLNYLSLVHVWHKTVKVKPLSFTMANMSKIEMCVCTCILYYRIAVYIRTAADDEGYMSKYEM